VLQEKVRLQRQEPLVLKELVAFVVVVVEVLHFQRLVMEEVEEEEDGELV